MPNTTQKKKPAALREDLFTWASRQASSKETIVGKAAMHKGTRTGLDMNPRQKASLPILSGGRFKISTHTFDTSSPLRATTPSILRGRFNNLFMLRDPGMIRRKNREPNVGRNRAVFAMIVGWAFVYTTLHIFRG